MADAPVNIGNVLHNTIFMVFETKYKNSMQKKWEYIQFHAATCTQWVTYSDSCLLVNYIEFGSGTIQIGVENYSLMDTPCMLPYP